MDAHPATEDIVSALEADQDRKLKSFTPGRCPRCDQRHLLGWGPLHCEADDG